MFKRKIFIIGFLPFLLFSSAAFPGAIQKTKEMTPCNQYLAEPPKVPDVCLGSELHGACQKGAALDQAAMTNTIGASIYTAVAAVCWACVAYPSMQAACTGSSLAAGVIDMAASQIIQKMGSGNFEAQAKKGRKALYTSNEMSNMIPAGLMSVIGGVLTINNMMNSSAKAGASAAKEGASAAKEGAQASKEAGSKADQQAKTACALTAGLSTVMATWKWTNMGIFVHESKKERENVKNLRETASAECSQKNDVSNPNVNNNPLASNTAPEVSGGGRSFSNPQYANDSIEGIDAPPFSTASLTSDALSDGGSGFQLTPDGVMKAQDSLQQNKGISINDLQNALANGASPSSLLAKLNPDFASEIKGIDSLKDKLFAEKKLATGKQAVSDLYALAGGRGGSKAAAGPDIAGIMSSLLNKGKGEEAQRQQGISTLKFGLDDTKPSDDIFHVRSSKNIFQIVSDRWQSLTRRYIREDQMRPNLAEVPTMVSQPEGTLRKPANSKTH